MQENSINESLSLQSAGLKKRYCTSSIPLLYKSIHRRIKSNAALIEDIISSNITGYQANNCLESA